MEPRYFYFVKDSERTHYVRRSSFFYEDDDESTINASAQATKLPLLADRN